MQHLPCERERSDEHGDRPQTDVLGGDRHQDAEQREAHVRDDELTEHAAVHLAEDRIQSCAHLQRLPFRDEDRVDRIADEGREQDGRADDEPMIVEVREAVEDLALRQHGEGDLRSDEDRGERRDLPPELADVGRPEQDDQRRDRGRIQQRDGQLEREAQAEVERHRHRNGHEIDDHDRRDPDEDRQDDGPSGEGRGILRDLVDEEREQRERDEAFIGPQGRPPPFEQAPVRAVGPTTSARPGHRAPRGERPVGTHVPGAASTRRSRWSSRRT